MIINSRSNSTTAPTVSIRKVGRRLSAELLAKPAKGMSRRGQDTTLRIIEAIISRQPGFFARGPAHLRPMVLGDIAEDIGMHQSTVSRVVSTTTADTPRGLYRLRDFFSPELQRTGGDDISCAAVRGKIQALVARERRDQAHSDQEIEDLLQNEGICVSRRTIAKYRRELGIESSRTRGSTPTAKSA